MLNIENVITHKSCVWITHLLDACYKWGIKDAAEIESFSLCDEYIEKFREPGVFGVVSERCICDWREWMLMLMLKSRTSKYHQGMIKYFDAMGRFGANYLSVLLVAAQGCYAMGLQDYNAKPDPNKLQSFMESPFLKWGRSLSFWNKRDFLQDVQLMLFRRSREESDAGYKPILKRKQYETFIEVLTIVQRNRIHKR